MSSHASHGSCDREMETYYLRRLLTLCMELGKSSTRQRRQFRFLLNSRNSRRIRSPPNLRKLSIFRSSRDLCDFFQVIATMNILFIELNDICVAVPGHLKNRRWSVAFRVKLQASSPTAVVVYAVRAVVDSSLPREQLRLACNFV